MAESSLSIGFPELQVEVGDFLGYGRTSGSWSVAQEALIDSIVQSGVRRVYYPPSTGEGVSGYEWSWLQPTTELAIVSGTSDYDLPDDFGRLVGPFHFPAEEYRKPAIEVSVSKILQLRTYSFQTGGPYYVATRFKSSDGSGGQRQEALFFPEPDDDWTMIYEYEAYNSALSDSFPYPLGGMKLSELYIESCLAVAESRTGDELSVHTQTFQALLVDAVARDRKHGAKYFGQMGHRDTEADVFRRGYTGSVYPIEYKGEDI